MLPNLIKKIIYHAEFPLRYFYGDDIFISYSRVDGVTYAEALASHLANQGYSCRLDLWDTTPGKDLPSGFRRAIRWSKLFVLTGTPAACMSTNVEKEIDEFLFRKGYIIPIDFKGTLKTANWAEKIVGLPPATEVSIDNLSTGNPSESVIKRIVNSVNFTKRNLRVQRTLRNDASNV